MQKVILIIALLVVASSAYTTPSFEEVYGLWQSWKYQHQKIYTVYEESVRFAIFADNLAKILRFNEENDTPKLGLNQFGDLTASEFKLKHSGCAYAADPETVRAHTVEREIGVLPASVDWRNKGAVTGVKDQGQCGSCWSFSTTGVLEGSYFIQQGTLLSFSEQQIIDCDTGVNQGCDGGWPYLAVEYAAQNGLELESDYPYLAQDGTCKYDKSKAHEVAKNYSFVTANSTVGLQQALVDQPVSVLIEADQDVFQFYTSGVIKTNCGASLDHAVLAVGYQRIGLYEVFIVKNSWGTSWGDEGYVYISANRKANGGQGVCGILAQPMVPTN